MSPLMSPSYLTTEESITSEVSREKLAPERIRYAERLFHVGLIQPEGFNMYQLPKQWQRFSTRRLERMKLALGIDIDNSADIAEEGSTEIAEQDAMIAAFELILDELDKRRDDLEANSESQAHYDSLWY